MSKKGRKQGDALCVVGDASRVGAGSSMSCASCSTTAASTASKLIRQCRRGIWKALEVSARPLGTFQFRVINAGFMGIFPKLA